jgi:hypothetical protein
VMFLVGISQPLRRVAMILTIVTSFSLFGANAIDTQVAIWQRQMIEKIQFQRTLYAQQQRARVLVRGVDERFGEDLRVLQKQLEEISKLNVRLVQAP